MRATIIKEETHTHKHTQMRASLIKEETQYMYQNIRNREQFFERVFQRFLSEEVVHCTDREPGDFDVQISTMCSAWSAGIIL